MGTIWLVRRFSGARAHPVCEFTNRDDAATFVRVHMPDPSITHMVWTIRKDEDTSISKAEFLNGIFDAWVKE